uniref:Transmembrane protein 104 n=1 Tax=Heterorhabditis bacteriophora TaxID=37862 RepID=A0A1I7XIH5_HETBA
MGDYDECIDVHHPSDTSYRTQFCWAHIYFPIKELMKAINLPFDDIVSVLNFLPKNLGFDTVCSVTCRQPDKDYSSGFWIVTLTVPYAMFLLFYAVMVPYVDSGPNEAVNIRDATNCRSSWWMNMLYINNVMPYNKECFGISWYLAADTQMFAFSPLFLVPFLFSPILGFTTLFCVLLFSTGISYIDIITLDLPITVVRAM